MPVHGGSHRRRVYDGVVTSVTNFGLFVQITELMIDGLVHVTSLPNDYYHFDPATMTLDRRAQRTKFWAGPADEGARAARSTWNHGVSISGLPSYPEEGHSDQQVAIRHRAPGRGATARRARCRDPADVRRVPDGKSARRGHHCFSSRRPALTSSRPTERDCSRFPVRPVTRASSLKSVAHPCWTKRAQVPR